METFKRVRSIAKAVSLVGGAMVAKSESGLYEVYASRHRCGQPGRRRYAVTFHACRVLSVIPRQVEEVPLPSTVHSNLVKVLAHLSKLT